MNSAAAKIVATTANLDDPNQGITDEALANTDAIIWWGHARHGEVTDETAAKVIRSRQRRQRFYRTALGALFQDVSGDFELRLVISKGGWREAQNPADTEEITVCALRSIPLRQGVEDFVLPAEEMYGAPFDVPAPLTVVFPVLLPAGR